MKFTKVNINGQLSEKDAASYAQKLGLSYVIAATGVLFGGLAGLFAAIRWW